MDSKASNNDGKSVKEIRLRYSLDQYHRQVSSGVRNLAKQLGEILQSKAHLPPTLSEPLREKLPTNVYSDLRFKEKEPTLECERCHFQQSVSEGESITVTRTMVKGELTGNSMLCKECGSQQNHHVGNSISEEDITTVNDIRALIQQIPSVSSGERGTSRRSADSSHYGRRHSNASYASIGGSHNSSSSSSSSSSSLRQ